MEIILGLFSVAVAAVLGGVLAKYLKLPAVVGYIVAGIAFGAVLPGSLKSVSSLAQLGTILLLFSIGVELSFDRLARFLKVAIFGAVIQIILVSLIIFVMLRMFGMESMVSLVLSLGFSLSSTAVVVKILSDRGELTTIHGEIMLGWLLVQDLAVIPIMVVLPVLANLTGVWQLAVLAALGQAAVVVFITIVLGRLLIPVLIHKVSEANSRELMLLASVALALGTAIATSFFGISLALGAFLAGVVISESQEHHAIFAETRPLRDLFVALFFVSLGFFVVPSVVIDNFALVFVLTLSVLVVKSLVVFGVSEVFGYRGKTAIANGFGLAQVGEFAFVVFSTSFGLKLIGTRETSIGIAVTLLTLFVSPILFKWTIPFWRKLKGYAKGSAFLTRLFSSGEERLISSESFTDHIIICGYGRVGKWVGRALSNFGIPFVVVEYNQNVVNELKEGGISVLYGDPTEPEVLEAVGIRSAKAVILAIPDRVAQEALVTYVQTVAPGVKIISRAHLDEDWEKLKTLRVDKVVQPEFEAAIEIIRSILVTRGKSKIEISEAIRNLRLSHSK